VSFTAELDRGEAALGDTVRVTVTLRSGAAPRDLQLPGQKSPDFEVVSRAQSSQTSFSLGGGGGLGLQRTYGYTEVLRPLRAGRLTIAPARCKVDGAAYETLPLELTVRPRGAAPPSAGGGGGDVRGAERGPALKVALDKKQAWVGEQVTATIYLVSPSTVLRYEGYRAPALEGFWAEDLETPQRLDYQLRYVDGVPYRFYLLRKLALFPTRAGRLAFDPVEADVTVQVGGDSFGLFPETRRLHRRSEPLALEVRPLPPGAPPGFDAADVGELHLATEVPERRVKAGQPFTVRLVASGRGNVGGWSLPRLPAFPGVQAFEPTVTDKAAREGDQLAGSRTAETVLVAEQPGPLTLPAVEWPFFDPRAGRYEVARVPEQRLEVLAAAGASAAAAPGRPSAPAARDASPGLHLARAVAWSALGLVVLGGALLAGRAALARRRAGAPARRRAGAAALARRRIEATGSAADPALAAGELTRALLGYLADRRGEGVAGLTRPELAALLACEGAPEDGVAALVAALDAADSARFGGGEAVEAVRARALEAIERLERTGEG
jgi:hypothetical protein